MLDLLVLALALPVFLIAGWPAAGFAVAAAAWLTQRGLGVLLTRRARRALAEGDRRVAFGAVAVSSVGRLWALTAPILVAGLIEREVGLAAAIMSAVLVTAFICGEGLYRALGPEEPV